MNEQNTNPVTKMTNRIDWSLVITLVVTAIVLAAVVYGMKKSGIKIARDLAANV